ncbi:MAG: saccharopine dehydrogenase C-terminal domain-containing protein [Chitinophagaceae bacterium]
MKNILLFGAGKSATVLIQYLLENAGKEGWHLYLVDADEGLAKSKIGESDFGTPVSFDILDAARRKKQIKEADIVISLLPPALHYLVAIDCLEFGKNLLTASYVDDLLKGLEKKINEAGLLFLCESGLDPGIDHMSAKKMLDEIKGEGGKVSSFISHCGGLVANESDNNPWHYKISWNPRNVVMAGKNGAHYKCEGKLVTKEYEELFSEKRFVTIPEYQQMSWYPNRDSLPYAAMYQLDHCGTFIRTTLRHPQFMEGWDKIIALKLTDEEKVYQTDGQSLKSFFNEHLDRIKNQFSSQQLDDSNRRNTEILINSLDQIVDENEGVKSNAFSGMESGLSRNPKNMEDDKLSVTQLVFLGVVDDITTINKGLCSAADVLQLMLEIKLPLTDVDKDLVVMMHEVEYETEDKKWKRTATLLVKGSNNMETAMAKTVGLPLGISAKLILNGIIKTKGLQVPVLKEIYEPVLLELAAHGIIFQEELERIS